MALLCKQVIGPFQAEMAGRPIFAVTKHVSFTHRVSEHLWNAATLSTIVLKSFEDWKTKEYLTYISGESSLQVTGLSEDVH